VFLFHRLCMVPLWSMITSAADKQRLEASTRRAVRSGLYAADRPSFSQLVADMDDKLLADIRHNPHHLLHKLLPDITEHTYNLRPRCHSFSVSIKTDSRNYVNRMLLKTRISSLHLYGCVLSICLLRTEREREREMISELQDG